jgi:hypothetical protein
MLVLVYKHSAMRVNKGLDDVYGFAKISFFPGIYSIIKH